MAYEGDSMKRMRDRIRNLNLRNLANRIQVEFDTRLRKSLVTSYPIGLIVEPRNYCNLRCPLCPTGQRLPTSRGTMKLETFTRIIDELHPYLRQMNLYYVGEPLLCEHLHEMISYAHQHKIRVSTSSNLTILGEEKAEELIKSGLDQLVVSLDGASQEMYEKYRIGGDFNKVINNVSLITEKKKELGSPTPQILIQFVIFKHNESDIPKAEELAKRLGVDIYLRQGALGGKGQSPPLTKDTALAQKWLTSKKEYQMEYDYFSRKPYIKDEPCGYLWKVATINWDGSVFPCCWVFENKYSFGNIHEQSFKAIWNNEFFQSSRRLFTKRRGSFSKYEAYNHETICYQCKMFRHVLNDPC